MHQRQEIMEEQVLNEKKNSFMCPERLSARLSIGLGLAISRKLCKMMNGDMVRTKITFLEPIRLQHLVQLVGRIRRRKRVYILFQD
jgi:hypothetical protein